MSDFVSFASQGWQAANAKISADDVSVQMSNRTDGIIDGTIRMLPMPWQQLARCTRALLPGSVTMFCADPGSGKSLLTVQMFWYLHNAGEKVALFELENDKVFHATRLLAQLSSQTAVTDPDWVVSNPDQARFLNEKYAAEIRAFGSRMRASPNDPVSHGDLLEWIDTEGRKGVRLFGIDPVTAASPTEKPWIADQQFITEARKRIDKYGASIWLVTHPRKGVKGSNGWDDLAGGAAWARFSDCVLWLERPEEPEDVLVATSFGRQTHTVNRRIRVCKARNGSGYGGRIGMWFDHESLTFREIGLIVGNQEAA